VTSDRTLRLQVLAATIAERLRPLCADWSDEVFDDMVRRLAEVTLKYEGVSSPGSYDRRATDKLVEELKRAFESSEGARDGKDR